MFEDAVQCRSHRRWTGGVDPEVPARCPSSVRGASPEASATVLSGLRRGAGDHEEESDAGGPDHGPAVRDRTWVHEAVAGVESRPSAGRRARQRSVPRSGAARRCRGVRTTHRGLRRVRPSTRRSPGAVEGRRAAPRPTADPRRSLDGTRSPTPSRITSDRAPPAGSATAPRARCRARQPPVERGDGRCRQPPFDGADEGLAQPAARGEVAHRHPGGVAGTADRQTDGGADRVGVEVRRGRHGGRGSVVVVADEGGTDAVDDVVERHAAGYLRRSSAG